MSPVSTNVAHRPLPFGAVRLADGFLGALQVRNSETSVYAGERHLVEENAWVNFANAAAGRRGAEYFGPVFEDGEVYKWLEAAAWSYGRTGDPQVLEWLERYTDLIASAQSSDGYLNTFFEVSGERDQRYELLTYDHEIFNMGAMIQAAVAQYRATGRTELLDVARRAADHLVNTFGPGKRDGVCGHPVIEMALVELYRSTREERYLDLAKYFVEFRGHQTLIDPEGRFGIAYFSDRVPVRETTVPEGHAVRAVYLASGATDVAIETGDAELLEKLKTQWDNMVDSKMYVTGGLGSRWEGESFGDPYELPSDRAYAETCAAIASMQWSWRLFLATGDAKYADLIERQFYNAVLPGVSLDGDSFFYVNGLQVRSGALVDDPGQRNPANGRQHWFGCSCCPTNLMRTLASIHHYMAAEDEDGIQLLQYATGEIEATTAAGRVRLAVETNYPWSGTVTVTVLDTPAADWTMSLRVPGWAEGAGVSVDGTTSSAAAGIHRISRSWKAGDVVTLELPMAPRLTTGNPRVDDVRGSVAIERGPLVYAIEQVDQADGVIVDDVTMTSARLDEATDGFVAGMPVIVFDGVSAAPSGASVHPRTASSERAAAYRGSMRAIPYFAWANREVGPMRVWIPFEG